MTHRFILKYKLRKQKLDKHFYNESTANLTYIITDTQVKVLHKKCIYTDKYVCYK